MIRSFLLTLLILVISFSCEEQENTVESGVNFEEASTFLSDMFTQTIRHSINNAKFEVNKGQLKLTNSDITGNYLQENYFPELKTLELSSNFQFNARSAEDEDYFSEDQQSFISDLDYAMNNVESVEEFYSSIEEYRNRAISDPVLSDNQKFEMLAVVESSYALHEYLIAGGISEIKEVLPEFNLSNDRSARVNQERPKYEVLKCDDKENADCLKGSGCSVNWRSVWGSAVIGFFANGTRGAIAGCAGGTVVLPLIGTAGGCVGGAVFGAAGGYVVGALTGIATELLTSCGR
ncbi:MAG: hypothetical protein GDA51_11870 [Ekhidna sp.]|nr:hypothetical protein [Ekhidna sp.]